MLLAAVAVFLLSSCHKDKILTSGGTLTFSVDTLMFDTVFTSLGSATRQVKIFNDQKEKVVMDIRLKNENGPFRLNVNGVPGKEFKGVELAGRDSLWVFAAVTIDPTQEDLPFIVSDELQVTMNGKQFSIPFIAFGQNAYYIVDSVLKTQTWLADKPYVIMQNALVDEGETLTIPAGARIYLHQDSRLFVVGTLKVNGTATDSVVFQGDRLDPLVWIGAYIDMPGQWGGLYFFKQSYNNEIRYAVFKNGGAATPSPFGEGMVSAATIQVDQDTVRNGTPKLRIENSVIRSSQGNGILAYNSSIAATNCLIVECGGDNVFALEGGKYDFSYCTIGTYGSPYLAHNRSISLTLLNYFPLSQSAYRGSDLQANVTNCIVYGSQETEVFLGGKPDYAFDVTLENSLFKTKDPLPNIPARQVILNEDPLFVDRAKNDYHLQPGSPAIGKGKALPGITKDIEGKQRDPQAPTMGCYEF